MSNLLQRLRMALPAVQQWIDELLADTAVSASSIDTSRFRRLPLWVPLQVLQAARFVVVDRTPFPPVSQLGIPEFAPMEEMPMGGITYDQTYFLSTDHATDEGTHFHELIHTIQWSALGIRDFLLTYGLGLAMHGYENSPLEAVAFALQDSFEQGRAPISIENYVTDHAVQTRSAAQVVFRTNHVPWDA